MPEEPNANHDPVSHFFPLGNTALGVNPSCSVLAAAQPVKVESVLFLQPCKVTTLRQFV